MQVSIEKKGQYINSFLKKKKKANPWWKTTPQFNSFIK